MINEDVSEAEVSMNFNRIDRHIRTPAEWNGHNDNQAWDLIKPSLQKVGNVVSDAIRERPVIGISVGLVIGVALGCIVKRR